jgi:hypothetical protein
MNWMILSANLIACVAVSLVLWLAYGRAQPFSKRILVTGAAVLLGFILYFAVQAVWEAIDPGARIHGDIVVYDIYPFTAGLAVVIILIGVISYVRRDARPSVDV